MLDDSSINGFDWPTDTTRGSGCSWLRKGILVIEQAPRTRGRAWSPRIHPRGATSPDGSRPSCPNRIQRFESIESVCWKSPGSWRSVPNRKRSRASLPLASQPSTSAPPKMDEQGRAACQGLRFRRPNMAMEVSGIAFRPLPSAGFRREADTHFADSSVSVVFGAGSRRSCKLSVANFAQGSTAPSRNGRFSRVCMFSDDGHSRYYASAIISPTCGGKKKEKEKCSEAKEIKKRMKLIKGLSKDLSAFSGMGFGIETVEGLTGEVKGKMISEAAEVLLAQLQLLRAEEKELKRKKKEEKVARKAMACKKDMVDSSSSSDSSDSDCGEVVDMNRLRIAAIPQAIEVVETEQPRAIVVAPPPTTTPQASILELKIPENAEIPSFLPSPCGNDCSSCCRNTNGAAVSTSANKIEVCMGGKCKRSGAMELLAEFEKMVGIEGAVVGCKCMGKCREGPNVRVSNGGESLATVASNPLCLGVRLDDVGTIVANFFGDKKDAALVAV
ncbi:hypothetical protein ACLOJK_015749 [Asimina triloba]